MTSDPGAQSDGHALAAKLAPQLKAHVEELAEAIGERNVWKYRELVRASRYIEHVLRSAGLFKQAVDGRGVSRGIQAGPGVPNASSSPCRHPARV